MIHGIGHNNGPSMEAGQSWRRHVWTKARADLLPRLPIEVLRLRVKRAKDLGLPYRTYASVRASTGRDVIGFLFSSNALRVVKAGQPMPDEIVRKLGDLRECQRIALTHPRIVGLKPEGIDAEHLAPAPDIGWSGMRDHVRGIVRHHGMAADGVLVIGETHVERDWSQAGRTAGFLTGARYFAPDSA